MGNKVLLLLIGAVAGFSLAYLLLASSGINMEKRSHRPRARQRRAANTTSKFIEYTNTTIADQLYGSVRVLCWVLTYPDNHERQAKHVKATWGRRCNVLLFMSTEQDNSLPTINLAVREQKSHLWGKTKAAFKHIYEYYRNEADWFLKADDDTYVIVENLRYLLSEYDSNDPIYFGCRFKSYMEQGYMSGGAGYVLSRQALDRLIHDGLPDPAKCKGSDFGAEDFEIGRCLALSGVTAMDSRDDAQRGRFFPFHVRDHLFPNRNNKYWYWNYQFYPDEEGLDCCSRYAISFHYMSAEQMYIMDYLLYELKPYGLNCNAMPIGYAKPM